MPKFPEITMYIKVGLVGFADEVNETITLSYDDNLSEEDNMKMLSLNAQLTQAKMQLALSQMLMNNLPGLIEGMED